MRIRSNWRSIVSTLLVVGALVVLPAADARADAAPQVRSWLEANIPQLMADAHLPGFSIAVVRDGKTIYAEGFGARDPQTKPSGHG